MFGEGGGSTLTELYDTRIKSYAPIPVRQTVLNTLKNRALNRQRTREGEGGWVGESKNYLLAFASGHIKSNNALNIIILY